MGKATTASVYPEIVISAGADAGQQALALLRRDARSVLLVRARDTPWARDFMARVDRIFSDIDGTLTDDGASMTPQCIAALQGLAAAGISLTLVTGKPHDEIVALAASLPPALPLHILYEKGAYEFVRHEGKDSIRQLLATAAIEEDAAALRRMFTRQKIALERACSDACGTAVMFGWAGSGSHKSLLSIDVFQGIVPSHYRATVGAERAALKVRDPQLLARIARDLERFLHLHQPAWSMVHLMNGNYELGPKDIEKDRAILQTCGWQRAQAVLVLGDSANDCRMFALRSHQKVAAGLVLHREAAVPLVGDVDFVSFGAANPIRFLRCLPVHRSHSCRQHSRLRGRSVFAATP